MFQRSPRQLLLGVSFSSDSSEMPGQARPQMKPKSSDFGTLRCDEHSADIADAEDAEGDELRGEPEPEAPAVEDRSPPPTQAVVLHSILCRIRLKVLLPKCDFSSQEKYLRGCEEKRICDTYNSDGVPYTFKEFVDFFDGDSVRAKSLWLSSSPI